MFFSLPKVGLLLWERLYIILIQLVSCKLPQSATMPIICVRAT